MTNNYTTSTPKIALVTGGSRGIGRNTVESLAKRGVHTVFTYHSHSTDAEAVVVAVKDQGAQGIALQLDAGNIASFDAFVDSVKDALAKLGASRFDFLVNNAGGQFPSKAEDISLKGWKAVIETNLTGTFLCCREGIWLIFAIIPLI